jgi:predicted dehydrogenase
MSIVCLVKEVPIPDRHWYRWPREGTRITGNLCHWLDLGVFLLGENCEPSEMTISGPDLKHPDDEKGVNVIFRDGSSLSVITTSRGDDTLGVQELIQVRRGSLTIELNDYRRLLATHKGSIRSRLFGLRDKGHAKMYDKTFRRIKEGMPPLYTARELELSTLMTINATEMVLEGQRRRYWTD